MTDNMRPVVFGIGLEKTGTRSLHAALEILGWRSLHDAQRVSDELKRQPTLSSLMAEGFNAFCDNSILPCFRELDAAYPGSKFVYTVRAFEDWVASRLGHNSRTIHWEFDLHRLRKRWQQHDAAVREYFRNRPNDVLILRICEGDGWETLCRFLGIAIPNQPFPWTNRSPEFQFTADWFSKKIPVWQKLTAPLAGQPGLQALEIGSYEFRSGLWLLHNVCSHPASRLTCIDRWARPEVERRFDQNVVLSGRSNNVRKIKCDSAQVLPTLRGNSVDFIYVDGSHEASDVLLDALLGLRLLKPGGLMIFDDYELKGQTESKKYRHLPKPAIDAFLSLCDYCIDVVHKGYQVAVRKRRDSADARPEVTRQDHPEQAQVDAACRTPRAEPPPETREPAGG